jgi:predicted DNA-binding transcriptional regulator YafY
VLKNAGQVAHSVSYPVAATQFFLQTPRRMSQTERVYRIESLIRSRGTVSFAALIEALEVSPATLKRDLAYLRERLGAPIEYEAASNGYRFVEGWRAEDKHELPGLWFNERELTSLLSAHQLLSELDSDGVISRHLAPLVQRIEGMLAGAGHDATELRQRIRIVHPAKRPVPHAFFEKAAQALLLKRRLFLRYSSRTRAGAQSERVVSPQRLVHHRNTWYLDAWCHQREALLRFALDAVQDAQVQADEAAKTLPLRQVAQAMDAGYGVFAGAKPQWATLRFEAEAARWVSQELWHAQQEGRWLRDGRYELRLPFVDATELTMDVLRHGAQVQVLAPAALRQRVQAELQAALRVYEPGTSAG